MSDLTIEMPAPTSAMPMRRGGAMTARKFRSAMFSENVCATGGLQQKRRQ
jgi:hypothetical protein